LYAHLRANHNIVLDLNNHSRLGNGCDWKKIKYYHTRHKNDFYCVVALFQVFDAINSIKSYLSLKNIKFTDIKTNNITYRLKAE